jgi:peptidyl-prolyl cis-trans isomerase C
MMVSNNRTLYVTCSSLALLLLQVLSCHASDTDEQDDMNQARELSKPWLMRDLQVGGVSLFFSPATVLTVIFFLVNLHHAFVNPNWAETSHILIKDASNQTKKMMTEMKKDIGTDLKSFGDYAAKYSQCPSKSKKGDLGRFKPGEMTPPFDKVIFDKSSATGTALGPVQTQFGWHLIYIRQRKM